MSQFIISNGDLTVTVDSKGAEIKSIKKADREYMWHGDPAFWGRTSPVLFPVVGSLKNKEFKHSGSVYQMGQHGFARDTEFVLVSKSDTSICMRLSSNEDTRTKFPYDFVLDITYTIDNNSVAVNWKVSSGAGDKLDFSIGAHPAFLCDPEGYSFRIYGADELTYRKLTANGTLKKTVHELGLIDELLPITEDLFAEDALVFENIDIKTVGLVDSFGNEYLKVDFDAPLLGLWSPAGKKAPFVCIEPWYGRCDADDFTGDWEDREYSNHIEGTEVFDKTYYITIL